MAVLLWLMNGPSISNEFTLASINCSYCERRMDLDSCLQFNRNEILMIYNKEETVIVPFPGWCDIYPTLPTFHGEQHFSGILSGLSIPLHSCFGVFLKNY